MILTLRDGIASRLREHSLLTADVFPEDDVPVGRTRYARLRITGGLRDRTRAAGPQVGRQHRIWVTSVGRTTAQVALVQEAVLAQLVDWVPTMAGLSCYPIVHRASEPPTTDRTVTPPLQYAVDQLDLFAQPIP